MSAIFCTPGRKSVSFWEARLFLFSPSLTIGDELVINMVVTLSNTVLAVRPESHMSKRSSRVCHPSRPLSLKHPPPTPHRPSHHPPTSDRSAVEVTQQEPVSQAFHSSLYPISLLGCLQLCGFTCLTGETCLCGLLGVDLFSSQDAFIYFPKEWAGLDGVCACVDSKHTWSFLKCRYKSRKKME